MLRTLVLAPLLLLAAPAAAQDSPGTENGRYALSRTDDGYLRLDQQTGHVSICTRRDLGWACQTVPDERSALEDEIARLQKDNASLKKEMMARGLALPGTPQSKAQPKAEPDSKSPTDAEIDRALATAERIWRRFVEMIARLQRDIFTQI